MLGINRIKNKITVPVQNTAALAVIALVVALLAFVFAVGAN